jgi:hypothetical protein
MTADSIDGARRRSGQDRSTERAARGDRRGATQGSASGKAEARRDSEAPARYETPRYETPGPHYETQQQGRPSMSQRQADDRSRADAPVSHSTESDAVTQPEQSAASDAKWTPQAGPRDAHGRWLPADGTPRPRGHPWHPADHPQGQRLDAASSEEEISDSRRQISTLAFLNVLSIAALPPCIGSVLFQAGGTRAERTSPSISLRKDLNLQPANSDRSHRAPDLLSPYSNQSRPRREA